MFFDKYGSIQRLTALVSDANKESFQIVSGLEAIPINVQPASPETTALINGVFGKTYTVFTKTIGFREGDRLTVSGTFIDGYSVAKELQVMNVSNQMYGPIPHFEVTCVDVEQ